MPTRPEKVAAVADVPLDDTVVLVTGATDGVGRETALALGRLGATVIAHGRSESKVQSLEQDLAATNAAGFEVMRADFTDIDAARTLADTVASKVDHLDVVYNNAAAYFDTGKLTDVGVEQTFAVNHLAPFILTNRLRNHVESAGGRVVTTSSAIHTRAELDVDALESVADYDGMDAYARSKLANVLFTFALANRLDDATATCFHPGFIPGSGLYRNGSTPVRVATGLLSALPTWMVSWLVSDSKDGATAALYLGLSQEVEGSTGAYYDGMEQIEPANTTRDETLQEELWAWSERFRED